MIIKFNFLLALTIVILLFSCVSKNTNVIKSNNNDPCTFMQKDLKRYWKVDTIGNNGYRLLASEKLQSFNCDFDGMSRNKIIEVLGNPNSQFNLESKNIMRYKLTNYGAHDMPGQKYLDLYLDNSSTIVRTKFWTVGG